MLFMYPISQNSTLTSGAVSTTDTPVIIIDAGHGGEDGGAVSDSGLIEKDVNLDIAKTLKSFFLCAGFKIKMIRNDDNAIYDNTASSIREKKVSDIHNRSNICNSDKNNIYISIHQNMFEESKYKGTQVFYSQNNPKSKTMAEYVRVAVKGLLQPNNERECKAATSSIYVLDNATVPAILVECGFLSNPEEEQLLKTSNYKNALAYSIYSGFMEYYYLT